MKYSARTAIAVGVVAIMAAASCSTDEKPDDTLSFKKIETTKSYRLIGSSADFDSEADQSFGCQVQLLLPSDLFGKSVAELNDSIMSAAFDTTGTDITAIMDKAMASRAREAGYAITDTVLPDSVVKEMPKYLSRFDGFFSVDGDIESMSTRILSYAVTQSYYMPSAAHGMYTIRYINCDLATGKVIRLDELFTAEGIEALPEVIRDYAGKMKDTIGKTDITALPADNNYYLTPDGTIVFAYQPYEVASYAQGEIQIPIPAYILSQYLTPAAQNLLL